MSGNQINALHDDALERAAIYSSLPAENILLEGDDHEPCPVQPKSFTVQRRFRLNNRIRATRHELTLSKEGYLRIREQKRAGRQHEALLDLRYLNPKPALSRFTAFKVLYAALALLGTALILGALVFFSILPAFAAAAVLTLMAASAAMLWLFLYRTHERIVFRTTAGETPVLILRANPGCIRAYRALVPHIARAIADARQLNAASKAAYLRHEMREHYRLREAGVLSDDLCATGTQRILGRFD